MLRSTSHIKSLVLLLALAALACQETVAPDVEVSRQFSETDASAAGCTIDLDSCDPAAEEPAGSYAFTLNSFDAGTLVLSGTSKAGQPVSVQFTGATAFRPANLNLLPPNPVLPPNPIREYNDALSVGFGDGNLIYSALANLAAANVPGRVWIDKSVGVVRAFRPIN